MRLPDVVAQAEKAFGRIDVLVNNAGYGLMAAAENRPVDKYSKLFEVNLFGLVEMTRAVLPTMRRQRVGHIINRSSATGFIGFMGLSFYCASKFAVEGYSEALATETRHLGIHVTLVEPGGFRSDFAGPSLVTHADYAPVNRHIADYMVTRHGSQENDPAKFGPAMCAPVDAKAPPLRLPLGRDCLADLRANLKTVAAEFDQWEALSLSTIVDA